MCRTVRVFGLLFVVISFIDGQNADSITVTACENLPISISCPITSTVTYINIQDVFYGRTNTGSCPSQFMSNTSCDSSSALQTVQNLCEGQMTCTFPVTQALFTADPCPGTSKYLSVTYDCISAKTAVACEGSTVEIVCPTAATVIHILDAIYERWSEQVCTSDFMPRERCTVPSTWVIAKSCSGKTSCSLTADFTTLTDQAWDDADCPYTNQYLKVEYTCVPEKEPAIACEYTNLDIECPTAGTVINLLDIMYGRKSREVCPNDPRKENDCSVSDELDYVTTACDGEPNCFIPINTAAISSTDPCPGTTKYLSVTYICVPACSSSCAECDDENMCTSCVSGYYADTGSCQACYVCGPFEYETRSCTSVMDRICEDCVSPCKTCSSESTCKSCVCGYYLGLGNSCLECQTCSAGQYETTPCSSASNRQCSACSTCASNEYETTPCTAYTDRECSACRACAADQYETTSCSVSTNRQCSACTTCAGNQYESRPCSALSNRQCSACELPCARCSAASTCISCIDGYYMTSSRTCQACRTCAANQQESRPCSTSTDRQCSDTIGERCTQQRFFAQYQQQCLQWLCSRNKYRNRQYRNICDNWFCSTSSAFRQSYPQLCRGRGRRETGF